MGSNPKTIDMLIETYKKIANANPKQNNLEKKLLEIKPVLIIRYIIRP